MHCTSCGTELTEGASFCGKCGAKAVADAGPTVSSPEGDKLFAIAAHLGGIFLGFIPALVVYLVKKDSPGWVLDNAREALNWQITLLIVVVVLMVSVIGVFLLWAVWLVNVVFCILATLKSANREVYRYPVALRLIK